MRKRYDNRKITINKKNRKNKTKTMNKNKTRRVMCRIWRRRWNKKKERGGGGTGRVGVREEESKKEDKVKRN